MKKVGNHNHRDKAKARNKVGVAISDKLRKHKPLMRKIKPDREEVAIRESQ